MKHNIMYGFRVALGDNQFFQKNNKFLNEYFENKFELNILN